MDGVVVVGSSAAPEGTMARQGGGSEEELGAMASSEPVGMCHMEWNAATRCGRVAGRRNKEASLLISQHSAQEYVSEFVSSSIQIVLKKKLGSSQEIMVDHWSLKAFDC